MYESTWETNDGEWWREQDKILEAEYDPVRDVWFVPGADPNEEIYIGIDWGIGSDRTYEHRFHEATRKTNTPLLED